MKNLITSKRQEVYSNSSKQENVVIPGFFYDFLKSKKKFKNINNEKNYHWSNKNKLKRDLKKIFIIYNKLLDNLYRKLNSIHGKSFTKKYWEALIWVWLYRYITYYYDRWEIVSSLSKKYRNNTICKKFEFQEKYFIPKDTEDWCSTNVMSDDWNHWVLINIIEHQKKLKTSPVNKIKKKPKKDFDYSDLYKKENLFKRILKSIFLFKKTNIFSQNIGLTKDTPKKFSLFFQNFFTINKDLFWKFDHNIWENERNLISKNGSNFNSKFEKFLISQIKFNFPTIFLENYKNGVNEIKKQRLPVNPKIIITSVDDISNEPFKFYMADKITNGSKLFLIQHGGSYGTSDNFPIEKLQLKIADKYFSWGWKDQNKKVVPNFCLKNLGIKITRNKQTKGVLIPILDLSLYPSQISDGRPRCIYEINNYIKTLKTFFSSLEENIKSESAFKYLDVYKVYPNYVLNTLKSSFKKTSFFSSHKRSCFFLNKYKLNVEFFNSTGFLESFNLNLPTILIFDKSYCRIRKNSVKYFRLLEKARILFYDPFEAAKFVNSNYSNINEWWNSKKVQKALNIFVNKFAKSSDNPYRFLKKLEK